MGDWLWIEYGKHRNGLWIRASKVSSIRNIGKGGKRGSVLILDNGHGYFTDYPATELAAMVTGCLPAAQPGDGGDAAAGGGEAK